MREQNPSSSQALQVRVPGKLIIAGEYAILEPHHQAVVIAVDRFVTATIRSTDEHKVSLPSLGLRDITWRYTPRQGVSFASTDPRLHFIGRAMTIAHAYLSRKGITLAPYELTIESELDDPSGRKYGLGSSGAVVVAAVAAVLNLFCAEMGDDTGLARRAGTAVDPELLYKLAAIAHFQAQGSGSGVDVAASAYGGWLRYASFQPNWLAERLAYYANAEECCQLVDEPWPFFVARPLTPPSELRLCIGWTGAPASTGPLVKQIKAYQQQNPAPFNRFLTESTAAVSELIQSLEAGSITGAIAALAHNRAALAKLGTDSGVPIETPALADLHHTAQRYGGAGKPSGAGGGDCGVALLPDERHIPELYQDWRYAGIEPLPLQVSINGAAVVYEKKN
jgi:phosphomevalonate kinase